VADVHNGMVKGLRQNGVTVADVNLDDRLDFYEQSYIKTPAGEYVKAVSTEKAVRMAAKGIETACYEVWPEVVILTSGFFVTPETLAVLRRRPHHVVLWCTESPYEDSRQLNFAPYVDTIILNDPTNIEQFRQVNARTFYLPHSFDPDIHHPGPSDQRNDFAWVGTGFPSRMEFFEQVEWKDLRVVLGGMWRGLDPDSPLRRYLLSDDLEECCDNTTAADLYRGCTVSANLYRKESTDVDHADGWAMGPREVELAATGTFFLREPRGEGDELLHMLPTFTEPGEFTELLHHYVAHAAKAQELAAGRAQRSLPHVPDDDRPTTRAHRFECRIPSHGGLNPRRQHGPHPRQERSPVRSPRFGAVRPSRSHTSTPGRSTSRPTTPM
jgi:spore maturation protein CgeB